MQPFDSSWFERAMVSLEQVTGAYVTVIDHLGLFHTPTGTIIFPQSRQSHRKLAVCNIGFSSRCLDFCRHEMNRQARGQQKAFLKKCWKGVIEIVVPLGRDGEHWGMCYLGPWRSADFRRQNVKELPEAFVEAYYALPLWSDDLYDRLAPLLEAFAGGIVAAIADQNTQLRPTSGRKGEIMDYLSRNAASPQVSLQGLAAALHLSPSRTSRLLRELCEGSFTSLINEIRVNRAKVLLKATDDKLAAIAEAVGFSDEYHFSKVFRRAIGQAPGQYRINSRSLREVAPKGLS